MVTKNWATGPILKNLHPEYREPQEQQIQEDYDKDVEQDAGDVGGSRRYPSKAQNADDNRYQKENKRPFQKCYELSSRRPHGVAGLTLAGGGRFPRRASPGCQLCP